ncbi:MAG: serine/threonine protein kinase [Myxococcota bacterium]
MSAQVGHYEVIDRIAVGGVAEIFRARDVRTGDIVVIKRMRPDLDFDPDAHAGFLREIDLAIMCAHKNLIRGFEKGTFQGADYGVIEYVDGQDLEQVLERARKAGIAIPLPFATWIVAEICDGLDFFWRIRDPKGRVLGLVHRDVAPKNILLRYDGQIRVGDLGSAVATAIEPVENITGTLGYMSPEQARCEPLDGRSDVYAAGIILYELVTGQRAFELQGKADGDALSEHARGRMKSIPASVPADLSRVIERACALSREDRYSTGAEMVAALQTTATPPDTYTTLGIATLVRRLFPEEFKRTRLPGSPLPF